MSGAACLGFPPRFADHLRAQDVGVSFPCRDRDIAPELADVGPAQSSTLAASARR